MYKEDLALNNLQGWYAIKPNQTKPDLSEYNMRTFLEGKLI